MLTNKQPTASVVRRNGPRGGDNRASRIGLFGLVFVLIAHAPARADVHVGDPFPPLASAGLVGAPQPESSGKVLLVDFWASWCAPCKASFPAYGRLNAQFAPRGLVIIAVSVDEDPEAYESFARKMNPPFPVALDKSRKLVGAVQVPTMPTSYLIGRDGRVRYVHPGFHGGSTERELQKEIEGLLSEKSP
jgi:thiol-disulfide isomerase/thioredoxin